MGRMLLIILRWIFSTGISYSDYIRTFQKKMHNLEFMRYEKGPSFTFQCHFIKNHQFTYEICVILEFYASKLDGQWPIHI
eukprot:UN02859